MPPAESHLKVSTTKIPTNILLSETRDKKAVSNKDIHKGQAWWLTSVIPALWEAKVGRSLKLRNLRPACQHGETPSVPKI